MKKLKLPFFLFVLLIGVSNNSIGQTQFSVKKIEQIKDIAAGYNLQFVPHSQKILFTSENNNGLSIFDLKSKETKKICSEGGAGFEPSISSNGKTVFYKTFGFEESGKRLSNIISYEIETGESIKIIENQRELSSPIANDTEVSFISENKVKSYNNKTNNLKACDQTACFTSPKMDLVLSKNGKLTILNPFGKGNYIWVSLSPNKTKILFNKAGKGTFICDLNGKILTDLGRIHAAKWSSNGQYIIGMNDHDNGHSYTSSEIIIVDSKGKNRTELKLDSKTIALYPSFSEDNSKIIFNNEKGEAFLISLK